MSTIKKIGLFAFAAIMILTVCLFAACGGETDGHVHSLEHVEAVEATEEKNGNIEYWYCSGCGKYFSDADAKNEISASSIVTTLGGENDENTEDVIDPTKTVSRISIYQNPDKTTYEVGDEFTLEGGILLVTYTDGTTQYLPMTSSSVTYNTPGMDTDGTRYVYLECGGKSTNDCITVTVTSKTYDVVFNLNYADAPDATTVNYVSGATVEAIDVSRDGYVLYGWYRDADFTVKYEFGAGASEDLNLYALWLTDGVSSVTVTFDYDYYGAALVQYSYPMDSGSAIKVPADPERVGYSFSKWVDESGQDFDFSASVTSDTTVTAVWTKTATGSNVWVFEAEDTDLTGKSGSANSGTVSEKGMVVKRENLNCSNNYAISYLYDNGDSLEFYIACDEDVSDVTFEISLSQQHVDYTYSKSNFSISLNGDDLDYRSISFTNVPPDSTNQVYLDFAWYEIGVNLSLKKGMNFVQLKTVNSDSISGSTMKATAPDVDALRFTTSAVLIWDANYGLPATTNY